MARWAPHGVRVVSDTLVAVAINQKYPTPVDGADDGLKNWGGISGDYVNWETRPAALSVTMVCTSNPLKAWELR